MTVTFREREEGYEDWREMFSLDGLFHALRADAITTAEEWHEARKRTYSGDEWNSKAAWNDWTAFYEAALEQLCADMAAGTKSGKPWDPADEVIAAFWTGVVTDAKARLDELCRAEEGAK